MSDQTLACANCGAQLAPQAAWCGQCLTPVLQATTGVPAADGAPVDPRRPLADKTPPPEYSRWRGGPESFGPAGRVIMSILLAAGLFVGYFFFTGGIYSVAGVTIPVAGSIIMYGLLALFLGAWALKSIWKRTRVK